jgi:hypothetical protein
MSEEEIVAELCRWRGTPLLFGLPLELDDLAAKLSAGGAPPVAGRVGSPTDPLSFSRQQSRLLDGLRSSDQKPKSESISLQRRCRGCGAPTELRGCPPPGFSLRSRRGFLPAPGIEEHTSEIAVCVGKVGLQTQCLAQACLGLIETAKISQRIATVAQYLRNVPPDPKRAIIACQCLLMTPAFGQTTADFVPNPRIFGPSSASGRESVFDVLPE